MLDNNYLQGDVKVQFHSVVCNSANKSLASPQITQNSAQALILHVSSLFPPTPSLLIVQNPFVNGP